MPWWLAGGEALDRFTGRHTRDHADVDVELPRWALATLVDQLAD